MSNKHSLRSQIFKTNAYWLYIHQSQAPNAFVSMRTPPRCRFSTFESTMQPALKCSGRSTASLLPSINRCNLRLCHVSRASFASRAIQIWPSPCITSSHPSSSANLSANQAPRKSSGDSRAHTLVTHVSATDVEVRTGRPRREDIMTSHPYNNVSDYIYEKIGTNLHRQQQHPIGIIKTAIQSYFDTRTPSE